MPTQNPWKTAGVANILQPGVAIGDVYYVDGVAGATANSGADPMSPLLSITAAMALCTDDGNDVIVVLDYPENSVPAGEASPIVIDKNRVHVLGASYPYMRGDMRVYVHTPDAPAAVFRVQARWVEIAYFKLAGGTGYGCIETSDAAGMYEDKGLAVHHCHFAIKYNGTAGAPTYGIDASTLHTGNWMYVGDNVFYAPIISHGVYLNNVPQIRIERNHFNCVGGNGIDFTAGQPGGHPTVVDNYFAIDADGVAGKGINLGTKAVYGGLFAGNMANEGKTDMGSNPWVDPDTGAPKNAWMGNYLGITLTHPA